MNLPRLGDITVKESVLVSSTRGRYVRKRRWGEQSPGGPVGAARPGQAHPASHQPDEWPVSIAVAKDGSTAAASYREGTIWVRDSKTGKSIGAWENNFRANVALSSDGKCLGLDAWGGTVHRMMNPRTGQFLGASLHSPNMYTNRAFSPDGSLYYAQAAQHGYILDGVTGVEQRHIEVNPGEQLMYSFRFELLPDGVTCLILANDVITPDLWGTRFELQWWNLQTGTLDRKLLLSKSGALYPQMAVSGDGKTVGLRVIDQPGRRQPFIELRRRRSSGEVIGSLQGNSYDRNQQAEHLAFTNEDKTMTILNRSIRRAGEILACRIEEWDVATRRRLRSQQIKLARIPNETPIPVISGAANRLIYPAPIGLTFVDLTTCKSVQPGPAEGKR